MIDRKYFYAHFPFRPLKQKQVDAINFILDKLDESDTFTSPEQTAYVLSTIKHETADTYMPIAEYGKGKGRRYAKPDIETGKVYYGRGYVQLTWKYNYARMGELLNIDLVNDPDLAMQPEIAWKILELGMSRGLFTAKKLSDYINDKKCDFYNARKVINGLDCAKMIAGYAERMRISV
jgi:putative chitinase